jgi:hypothetical protein
MPAAVERAKEWWEAKAPRERRLLAILGATLVVCVLAWVGMSIRGGLRAIERKNDDARSALSALDRQRQAQAAAQVNKKPTVAIPDVPVALDSYLDPIIKEVGLESPTYPAPKETAKGAATGGVTTTEVSIKVSLKDLTIAQLKDLLEKVETRNPVIATTELHVKKSFRDPEKLDVDFTAVTYYKKKAGQTGTAAGGAKGAAAGRIQTGATQ